LYNKIILPFVGKNKIIVVLDRPIPGLGMTVKQAKSVYLFLQIATTISAKRSRLALSINMIIGRSIEK